MYIRVCASGVSNDCAARGYNLNTPGVSLTGRLRKSILVHWYHGEKKRPVDEGVSASMAECVVINNECFKEQISESFHTFHPSLPPSVLVFLPPFTRIAANRSGRSAASVMNIAAFRSALLPPPSPLGCLYPTAAST